MKYFIIVIFIFIIYILYTIIQLDKIDRLSLYYLFKYYNSIDIPTSVNIFDYYKLYITTIIKFLLIPFKSNNYLTQFSKGMIHATHIPIFYTRNDILLMNNKLFWVKIFNKYNINHPKLIGYNIDNKIVLFKYNDNTSYIIKQINGTFGDKIKKIKSYDIKNELSNNMLVQDYLFDCKIYNQIRHFRYISLYNGDSFILWELTNNITKIAANNHNGGNFKLCDNIYCNSLSINDNNNLQIIIKQLNTLHIDVFSKIFYIGWDIMLDCTDNNIRSYCLEGNLYANVWYDNIDDNIVNKFKDKYKEFLITNKLL
jgi:hypothetical protein